MFLGIEIGGTKLQLAVGDGTSAQLTEVVRHDVDASRGAVGILEQIETSTLILKQKYPLQRIGIGFGGPVNSKTGIVTKSHQIHGWDGIALVNWCQQAFQLPAVLGNDCDVAALAEARYGAARGTSRSFFITVGTGVGGGMVLDGKLQGAGRPAIAEIGHLRPGLHEDNPELTVESLCAGPAIAGAVVARITGQVSRPLESLRRHWHGSKSELRLRIADQRRTEEEYIADLLQRCDQDPQDLTAKMISIAAQEGNIIAREAILHACQVLGWAIAQVITLTAPECIVIGGGVSLMGEELFFEPLREEVARYVFPPLRSSYQIVPAQLGELVVLPGAIALAAEPTP